MKYNQLVDFIDSLFSTEKIECFLCIGIKEKENILYLQNKGYKIYVVDESESDLIELKGQGKNKIYIYIDTVNSINFKENFFSGIVCVNKGLENISQYVLKAYRYLNQGGIFLIDGIYIEKLKSELDKFKNVELIKFSNGETLLKCVK